MTLVSYLTRPLRDGENGTCTRDLQLNPLALCCLSYST